MKRRLCALVLAAVMVLTVSLPGLPTARAADSAVVLDLAVDSIYLFKEGYRYESTTELTPYVGPYCIRQTGGGTPTDNSLFLMSAPPEGLDVTLDGKIWIDVTERNRAYDGVECYRAPIRVWPGCVAKLHLNGTTRLDAWLEEDGMSSDVAALEVPSGAEITLDASSPTGTLIAQGGQFSAGIGGSGLDVGENKHYHFGCGNITILSGIYDVKGGPGGAGIGTGIGSDALPLYQIRILGGHITAQSQSDAAGIGGGIYRMGTSDNGLLEIGGTAWVEAYASGSGAAIGGGMNCSGTGKNGEIRIGGSAQVTAWSSGYGAAIGGGGSTGKLKAGDGTGDGGRILLTGQPQVQVISEAGVGIGGGLNPDDPALDGAAVGSDPAELMVEQNAVLTVERKKPLDPSMELGRGACIGGRTVRVGTGTANGFRFLGGTTTLTNNASGTQQVCIGGFDSGSKSGSLRVENKKDAPADPIPRLILNGPNPGFGYISFVLLNAGEIDVLTPKATLSTIRTFGSAQESAWLTLMENTNATDVSNFKGILFRNTPNSPEDGYLTGQTWGPDNFHYKLDKDRVIPEGKQVVINPSHSMTIPAGTTLTVEGQLTNIGLALTVEGQLLRGEKGLITDWPGHTHDMIFVEKVDPTCIAEGCKAHWMCRLCGRSYWEEEALKYASDDDLRIPLDPDAHAGVTGPNYKAPQDCQGMANGTTGGLICPDCKKTVRAAQILYGSHLPGEGDACKNCHNTIPPKEPRVYLYHSNVCYDGEELVVPIRLGHSPNLSYLEIGVSYDSKKLTLNSVEQMTPGAMTQVQLTDSVNHQAAVLLEWSDPMGRIEIGNLALLHFTYTGYDRDQDFPLTLIQTDNAPTDDKGAPVVMHCMGGYYRCSSVQAGDADCNGRLDVGDAQYLARALANWADYQVPLAAGDCNHDGKLDVTDLGLAERKIARWEDAWLLSDSTGEAALTMSSAAAQPGELVQLALSLDKNTGLQLAQLELSYDASKLELVKAENVSPISRFVEGNLQSSLPYRMILGSGTDPLHEQTGQLTLLTFRVLTEEAGPIPVTLTEAGTLLLDRQLAPMELQLTGGVIDVIRQALSGTLISAENGTATLQAAVDPAVQSSAGTLWAASYDAAGRMLGCTVLRNPGTNPVLPDLPQGAEYRLFLTDRNNRPIAMMSVGNQ